MIDFNDAKIEGARFWHAIWQIYDKESEIIRLVTKPGYSAALPPTVPEWTDGYEIDDHYIKLQDDLNIGAARKDHSLMDQIIPQPKDY